MAGKLCWALGLVLLFAAAVLTQAPLAVGLLGFFLLLTLLLMLVLAPAAYADTDANTPQITQQPDQLVLQLGARWAGVEFELRTDAGVFPVPVVVDESGILRMDLGGSTTYTLSCINSTVPIPDPEPTEPDTPPTTQQDPAPSQPPTNNTSGSNTRNVVPVVFFLAALALAVVANDGSKA